MLDDLTTAIDEKRRKEINIEVKLHINKKLFEKGVIPEYMYIKANEMILKGN